MSCNRRVGWRETTPRPGTGSWQREPDGSGRRYAIILGIIALIVLALI